MRFRTLGHSGLKLSTVGLGSWLTYGGSLERDAARACIVKAYDLGVTFFDTADFYYEWHDSAGRWWRSYGNGNWAFAPMVSWRAARQASTTSR